MERRLFVVITSAWLLASVTTHALAETSFTTKGVKVVAKWVVGQTNMKLSEAPGNVLDDKANQTRFGYLDTEVALAKLWKAWRKDKPPKVDFSKQVVLVLTHFENAEVKFTADLEDKGNLKLGVSSTERGANGMTYVIAVIDRGGIKSINGKPLQSEKPKPGIQAIVANTTKMERKGAEGGNLIGSCSVDGIKGEGWDAASHGKKAYLRITDKTKLEKIVDKKRRPATLADLKKGCKIEFAGYGPVFETSPVIVYPKSVVIIEKAK